MYKKEQLDCTADGRVFRGVLVVKDRPAMTPGILVLPDAFGLGDFAINQAGALAGPGYNIAADRRSRAAPRASLDEAFGARL